MDGFDLASDPLKLALSRELRSGERVVWEGRQIGRLSLASFGIYLFAIPWTLFSLFWTGAASAGAFAMQDETSNLSWLFPLFGVPFILIGLGMLATPFLPLWQKGRVLYAVTNERVLKIQLGRNLSVQSVPGARIGMIERKENRDGTGSLKMAISVGKDSDGDAQTEHFTMGEIPDVLTAQDRISDISARSRARLPAHDAAFSS